MYHLLITVLCEINIVLRVHGQTINILNNKATINVCSQTVKLNIPRFNIYILINISMSKVLS